MIDRTPTDGGRIKPAAGRLRQLNVTFLDQLLQHFHRYDGQDDAPTQYRLYGQLLRDERVKRILFDTRQAAAFTASEGPPPEHMRKHLRMPFDAFYMEFTEPVAVTGDWQVDSDEYLRALLVGPSQPFPAWHPPTAIHPAGEYRATTPLFIAAFLADEYTQQGDLFTYHFVDRAWRFDLATGQSYVNKKVVEELGERRYTTDNVSNHAAESRVIDPIRDVSTGLDAIPENDFFPAGFNADLRNVGWWERATMAGSSLLQWCLAYMMAKSIILEVQQPPMSRQQRRWHSRKGIPLPQPWHVVKVDPRHQVRLDGESEEHGPGGRHSYRYDVMGHLRMGLHHKGPRKDDGTYDYVETIEWVAPHQRGLANDLYIPATRAVQAGRKVPPEIRRRLKETNSS